MDQKQLNLLISVKNNLRNAIYSHEKILEREREDFKHMCRFLEKHCTHDWCATQEETMSDFCRRCGVSKNPSDCEHKVWVHGGTVRDHCLSCAVSKTPEFCTNHEWVGTGGLVDDVACRHCGAIK